MAKNTHLTLLIIGVSPSDYANFSKQGWNIILAKDENEAFKELKTKVRFIDVIIAEVTVILNYEKLFSSVSTTISRPPIIATASNELLRYYELALNNGAIAFIKKQDLVEEKSIPLIKQVIKLHKLSKPGLRNYDEFITGIFDLQQKFDEFLHAFDEPSSIVVLEGADGSGKRLWLESLGKRSNLIAFDVGKLNENISANWLKDKHSQISIRSRKSSKSKIFVFWGMENANYILQNTLGKWLENPQKVVFVYNKPMDLTEQIHYKNLLIKKISIPALKDRITDLELIVNYFLYQSQICPRYLPFYGKEIQIVFQEDAIQLLREYSWSANIRELKNVVKQSIYHADLDGAEIVKKEHLPQNVRIQFQTQFFKASKEKLELFNWLNDFTCYLLTNKDTGDRFRNNTIVFSKLRRIKQFHTELLDNVEIKRILTTKYIIDKHLFVLSASESIKYADILKKQLKSVPVKVYDNHESANNEIGKLLHEAVLIPVILCPDLILLDVFEYITNIYLEEKDKVYDEKDKEFKRLIPIRGKPILEDHHYILSELQMLPRGTKKSIQEHDEAKLELAICQIAGEIVGILNRAGIV
jgi:DNA-binding NtrC family response regulator